MLNEWQEFLDYTGPVTYKADGKKDTTWLGRFTFEVLREFGGLSRILAILARGFLFHSPDERELDGQPRERMDYARRGLCAWCSVPEHTGTKPEWQYRTDFGPLHEEFPALVDEDSRGWLCRHFHAAMDGLCAGQPESGSESVFRSRRGAGQKVRCGVAQKGAAVPDAAVFLQRGRRMDHPL